MLKPRKARMRLAQEFIDIQNDDFGHQIEAIITEIKTNAEQSEDVRPLLTKLETLVEKRLGMRIMIDVFNQEHPAAIIPFIGRKHVFRQPINDSIKRQGFDNDKYVAYNADQDYFLKDKQNKKGFVDTKKARLSGIFSEYRNLVLLNIPQLMGIDRKFFGMFGMPLVPAVQLKVFTLTALTPAEVTAVLLHELGHGFYAYEYADRVDSTNQVLANIALEITGKKEVNKEYVYKELKSINDSVTTDDIEAIVSGGVMAGVTLHKVVFSEPGKQLGSSVYDQTSFEAAADNFASRFGYGRHIVTALDKIGKTMYFSPDSNLPIAFLRFYQEITGLVGFVDFIVMMLQSTNPFSVVQGVGYVVNFLILVARDGTAGKVYSYDETRDRYLRVRRECVNILKDSKLSKDEVKNIMQDIYVIDEVLKMTINYKGVISIIADFVLPGNRRAIKSINEQQLMEKLASNDLFMKAAQLRNL